MNVWIVNPFDNLPLEGYRPMRFWLMAEAFQKAGHDVVYWTSDFSHANKKSRSLKTGCEVPFSLELLKTEPYFKNVSLRRLRSHRKLAETFLKESRAAVASGRYNAPDFIIASSPPLELVDAAHVVASEVGARVVVDIMDAWPETFERIVPRFLLWPLRRLARRNYLRAAAITAVADNYVELARSYGFAGEIRRFYHGISIGARPRHSKRSGPLRIVYAGNMGRSYDLATAVEAVAKLDGLATLDIAGKGEQEEALKAIVESRGVKGVKFHGYLSGECLDRLLSESDIGLVPMDPSSCVGIPYKLADYAKNSLAIASSLGGESAGLLNRYGAGVSYDYGSADSLVKAIKSISSGLEEKRSGARMMAEREFSADKIYADYVKMLETQEF